MATNSLQSLNSMHPLGRRQSLESQSPPPQTQTQQPPLFLTKPNTTKLSISSSQKTFSISSSSSSSSISTSISTQSSSKSSTSFDLLHRLLSANDFREADNETRRLLIALAGEAAVKRGYVFFSEVQFISETDLKQIDELWTKFSNNKFGYSVQKKLFDKSDNDFTRFFIKVGWMKKLDTEVVQYNYRAFPDEFIWELNEETPEGHLPLTNALRGTQLLSCIFSHPAFANQDDEVKEEDKDVVEEKESKKQTVGKGLFKTNYSF
uniref:tetrapyrrole-binding protein, chloroplastic n=1 Tax=Erigeron canadensis TaxID=72917 RepID=UPI001CB8AD15|nr:tetrapyrrole-binding protein, chloroplastic [Erigeron canadensis]